MVSQQLAGRYRVLTSFGGCIYKARADRQEHKSFSFIFRCILRHDHIQSGLRNGVGSLVGKTRIQDESGVAHAAAKSYDLLGRALTKEREEGIDGVNDAYDVNMKLRKEC